MEKAHPSRGIYTDAMIYSPDVPFFKDDNGHLLDKPFLTSIITSPVVNYNAAYKQGVAGYCFSDLLKTWGLKKSV